MSKLFAARLVLAAVAVAFQPALAAAAGSPAAGPEVNWWVLAGGGAPSSGGNVSLDDSLGQPVIGSASGGSVALADGYWPGAGPAAPLNVVDLRASLASTLLRLDWSAVTQNEAGETITGVTYNVYRALDQPYFDPVTPYDSDISAITYTDSDPNAIGDTAHSYTYVVRAFYSGAASAPSNRVGVFSFSLVPGSSPLNP